MRLVLMCSLVVVAACGRGGFYAVTSGTGLACGEDVPVDDCVETDEYVTLYRDYSDDFTFRAEDRQEVADGRWLSNRPTFIFALGDPFEPAVGVLAGLSVLVISPGGYQQHSLDVSQERIDTPVAAATLSGHPFVGLGLLLAGTSTADGDGLFRANASWQVVEHLGDVNNVNSVVWDQGGAWRGQPTIFFAAEDGLYLYDAAVERLTSAVSLGPCVSVFGDAQPAIVCSARDISSTHHLLRITSGGDGAVESSFYQPESQVRPFSGRFAGDSECVYGIVGERQIIRLDFDGNVETIATRVGHDWSWRSALIGSEPETGETVMLILEDNLATATFRVLRLVDV